MTLNLLKVRNKISNSLAVRSSYLSGSNGSRCMEILSYDRKEGTDFSKTNFS
jgi:hypothetical protein